MKLFKMYGMEKSQPTSTLEEQLCLSTGQRHHRKPLASARQKLYRAAVGQLLWATPVRPDISFAVKELSRSLKAPTQEDEQQLKQVLRYLKGSLHFMTSLQPPRKREKDRTLSIHVKACFDSAFEGSNQLQQSTSGATLSLWGVPVAAFSRTQAAPVSSSAEAELYAMAMAVQISLHLKSLLQEMHLSQLGKPFELSVFTDSSNGKALALKLGLTRKTKHVQLRFVFMNDLLVNGQPQLCKIPACKNPAAMVTKHLPASTLHKLLPKLGVRTRAADTKDLLSMLDIELPASSSRAEQSSFFIGMMAEQPATAQLVEPRVASRLIPSSSFRQHSQEEVPTLPTSQRCVSIFRWYFFLMVALRCAESFGTDSFVNSQLCRSLSYECFIQLRLDAVSVFKQWILRLAFWSRPWRFKWRGRSDFVSF